MQIGEAADQAGLDKFRRFFRQRFRREYLRRFTPQAFDILADDLLEAGFPECPNAASLRGETEDVGFRSERDYVRFGSLADMTTFGADVRFALESVGRADSSVIRWPLRPPANARVPNLRNMQYYNMLCGTSETNA